MVFDSRTVCLKSSRLFGPESRPIQPSGIPSASVAVPVCPKENQDKLYECGVQLRANLGILIELVGGNEINGKDDLDTILLSFLDKSGYLL